MNQRIHDACVNLGITPPLIVNKQDPEWSHIIMFLSEYETPDIKYDQQSPNEIVFCYGDIRSIRHPGIRMIFNNLFSNPRKLKIKVL